MEKLVVTIVDPKVSFDLEQS